jgi:hypothetical protein
MRFAPTPSPSKPTSPKSSPTETLLPIFSKQAAQQEPEQPEIPEWKLRKAAIRTKINGERWNPPRKVSPDAQDLMRALNAEHPLEFTPNVLRKHFGISYESVRRILKSKWEPSTEQTEQRRKAWHERGKMIWEAMAAEGHKPPARWRKEGVGKVDRERDRDGVPSWKREEWYRRKTWWEREVEGKALGIGRETDGKVE